MCVSDYLQGSIFAEGGHALHKTTHLLRNRLDNLRQNPGYQVLRHREDLVKIKDSDGRIRQKSGKCMVHDRGTIPKSEKG